MKKKTDTKAAIDAIKGHVKGITSIVASCGVAAIMGNVMKEYKPDAKGLQKVFIKIGAAAITGMVIKSVTDYLDEEIDEIFEMGQEVADRAEIVLEEDTDETEDGD